MKKRMKWLFAFAACLFGMNVQAQRYYYADGNGYNWTSPPEVTTMTSAPCRDLTGDGYAAYRESICNLVNLNRAHYGLPALQLDPRMNVFAQMYATDMARRNFYSHVDPEGRGLVQRLLGWRIPYHAAGENIALGQPSTSSVMEAWMASHGHRANILSAEYTRLGVGVANSYWVQEFVN